MSRITSANGLRGKAEDEKEEEKGELKKEGKQEHKSLFYSESSRTETLLIETSCNFKD